MLLVHPFTKLSGLWGLTVNPRVERRSSCLASCCLICCISAKTESDDVYFSHCCPMSIYAVCLFTIRQTGLIPIPVKLYQSFAPCCKQAVSLCNLSPFFFYLFSSPLPTPHTLAKTTNDLLVKTTTLNRCRRPAIQGTSCHESLSPVLRSLMSRSVR